MKKQVKLQFLGQEVGSEEVNAMGQAGLMDDIVFAELLRLKPFDGSNVVRGIIPHRFTGSNLATVSATSTGVLVSPFRAVIGTRTAAGTDALANHEDIRSVTFYDSTTSRARALTFASNTSGSPRWDLVWALVTVDTSTVVSRFVKPVDSSTLTPTNVNAVIECTVTVGVTAGTPGTPPAFPAAPADLTGPPTQFYIPLAWVRLANGYTTGGVIASNAIAEAATVLTLSTATGLSTMRPASGNSSPGAGLIGTASDTWGTSGAKPGNWIQPSMNGCESIQALIPASASTATIIDASTDWRKRHFRITYQFRERNTNRRIPAPGNIIGVRHTTQKTSVKYVPLVNATPAPGSGWVPAIDGWSDATSLFGDVLRMPISQALVDGYALDALRVEWQVTGSHVTLPDIPTISVVRVSAPYTTVDTLNSSDAVNYGIPVSNAITVGAYEASAAVQSSPYFPDQNATIDLQNCTYFVSIYGEAGIAAVPGTRFFRLKIEQSKTLALDLTELGGSNYFTLANSLSFDTTLTGSNDYVLLALDHDHVSYMTAGTFGIYVDGTDGSLRVYSDSVTPASSAYAMFVWIEATGPVGSL